MGRAAVEHVFSGQTVTYANYDQDKTVLGPLMMQHSSNWAGPYPIGIARPYEAALAQAWFYPYADTWSSDVDWIFLADATTPAATRKVLLYEYNRLTQQFYWQGYVNITFPTATNHTIRAVRGIVYDYSTGTVGTGGVPSVTLTGSGTQWQTARLAAGSRIGFGTTDPTQVTDWYYVSAIGGEGTITLTGSATVANGTPYVIEEIRLAILTTNATLTNGGLFLVKGLNKADFSATGTNIAAAASTDNVKACYWLKDAASVTLTIAAGVGLPPEDSSTQHYIYCLNADTTTTLRVYKFNMRAALTVSSGASTNAFEFKTGATAATTGTIPQTNNGRYAIAQHGPGAGQPSIYFVTVSRVYRINIAALWDTSTNFITDGMQEIPPGSVTTYAATGALSSIEYGGTSDRFYITTSASSRQYYTQYRTDGMPWDYVWASDTKQIDQSSADPNITPHPSLLATALSIHAEGGMLYVCRNGASAILHHLYAIPTGANWETTAQTNSVIITPRLATPKCQSLYRYYVSHAEILGSDNLGMPTEPFRVSARTSGFSDNSGTWTTLPTNGSLAGLVPSDYIQFKFEFRIMGLTCIPARLFGIAATYEDDTADSHYQPSVTNSSAATATFAWRHAVAFGGNVPALRIRLYNAVTDDVVVDDNTTSPTGTWERSTNGGSGWVSWTNADKSNETTYIRYTPASLPSNMTVRALLTQL